MAAREVAFNYVIRIPGPAQCWVSQKGSTQPTAVGWVETPRRTAEAGYYRAFAHGDCIVVISFKGLPPHDLGTAETGSAQAIGDYVEVTMNTLDSWHSPPGNLVRVQMSPAVARLLADRLTAAAVEVESNLRE